MKFVTLAKDFTAVHPSRPLIDIVTIKKGTRFGIRMHRTMGGYEFTDYGYTDEETGVVHFKRWAYFRHPVKSVRIPIYYFTKNSQKTLLDHTSKYRSK
tara:strand:- start:77 stop:370 length:294 start_codon:yes stop_codon:yes gene_type:complete